MRLTESQMRKKTHSRLKFHMRYKIPLFTDTIFQNEQYANGGIFYESNRHCA